jgi:hypothetical protein
MSEKMARHFFVSYETHKGNESQPGHGVFTFASYPSSSQLRRAIVQKAQRLCDTLAIKYMSEWSQLARDCWYSERTQERELDAYRTEKRIDRRYWLISFESRSASCRGTGSMVVDSEVCLCEADLLRGIRRDREVPPDAVVCFVCIVEWTEEQSRAFTASQ